MEKSPHHAGFSLSLSLTLFGRTLGLSAIFCLRTDRAARCWFDARPGRVYSVSDSAGRACCPAAVDLADFAVTL